MRSSLPLAFLAYSWTVLAQSFVPPPQGLSEVLSDKFPGAKITYKEVNGICETSEGVKSYSGYVHMPREFLPDAAGWPEAASGNLFFWYFQARNNPETAPTAIYMGGGPGYTTFDDSDVFPCYFNSDANSTTINEHSWNRDTNMLYVDQPLGSGFSYTMLANGTYDMANETFTKLNDGDLVPDITPTFQQATLQYRLEDTLTNTTMACARTLWRFSQIFFNDFPEWETKNDKIAVWSVSYGGLYAPIFAKYTVDQNDLIEKGSHNLTNATALNIGTVGLLNANLDARAMARGVPEFLQNNTYGRELVPDETVAGIVEHLDLCYDAADKCREDVAKYDPEGFGRNASVNKICFEATKYCVGPLEEFQTKAEASRFDITQNKYVKYPPDYNTAFFNQPWVQAGLGVPLNFTRWPAANIIQAAFLTGKDTHGVERQVTGDPVRYDTSFLSHLLERGVNVALLFGDLDLQCNWFSGENASLQIEFANKSSFAAAGYAPLVTNSSYEGGFVREAGLLSFSRIFQAGHSAGGYQPETVSVIFNRAMFGKDIATGEIELANNRSYSTEGEMNIRNISPDIPEPEPIESICYVHVPDYCTEEQQAAFMNGTAEIKNWVMTSPKGLKGLASGGGSVGGNSSDGEEDGGGDNPDPEDSSPKLALTMSWVLAMGVLAVIAV